MNLPIQEGQKWTFDYITKEHFYNSIVESGPAFALLDDRNVVLGCAGVWQIEIHRGIAWAMISARIGTDFIHFHKAVKHFLDECKLQRVEMAVETNFKQGSRWAEMLGFKKEGLMHNYYPNGSDAYLYARV
jgi:hypothetical protein